MLYLNNPFFAVIVNLVEQHEQCLTKAQEKEYRPYAMSNTVVCHIKCVALVVIVVYVLAHDIGIEIGYEHASAVFHFNLIFYPERQCLVIGKHVSQGAGNHQHQGKDVFRFQH